MVIRLQNTYSCQGSNAVGFDRVNMPLLQVVLLQALTSGQLLSKKKHCQHSECMQVDLAAVGCSCLQCRPTCSAPTVCGTHEHYLSYSPANMRLIVLSLAMSLFSPNSSLNLAKRPSGGKLGSDRDCCTRSNRMCLQMVRKRSSYCRDIKEERIPLE